MPSVKQRILSTAAALVGLASAATQTGQGPILAPTGLPKLTLGLIGDYGWTGWEPASDYFCNNVRPVLEAGKIAIPNGVMNDCDPGDRTYINNATALQEDTASYVGQICEMKGCKAFVSMGDNFYDSGITLSTTGINRFQNAWVDMYQQGIFQFLPWFQTLGNHDIVPGQAGVDFQVEIAPLYDNRWYFGTQKLPYYSNDFIGKDWKATFVHVDSDCFIISYQKDGSVYKNSYTEACYKTTQEQVDFLANAFAESDADWKFLVQHHGYMSSSQNYTELAPLVDIVQKHNGVVLNGHDHCTAHYVYEGTNFVLSGAAGFPQAGDCNHGVPLGPFVKFLGANSQAAANGFVTLDITKDSLNFEYYIRNMRFEGGDLYPVKNDLKPLYTFNVTQHST